MSVTIDKEKDTDATDACPAVIENYRVGDRLGKGAFATVYKALDADSGDFVALKRIRVDRIKNKQLMKLLAEGHLMEQLEHENVVKFLGAIETENHIHLVLEYVDSGSLSSVVQKYGTLSEKLAATYMRQVLTGLAYLHANGVVHRDVKSHNLLISNNGTVKLADFGIAHLYGFDGAQNMKDTDVGSPYWMAPEVIQLIEASPASDIWSIGCTVIELMTGQPPYYELSKTAACFRMVDDEHPPLPESVSPELRSFLLRCFKKDPKDRATAAELVEDLWIAMHQRKAPMKKHVSITNLPRFQVNAQESKKAERKAAMVKKSISVTTLPRYAVNPTLSSDVSGFQSLRGSSSVKAAVDEGSPKEEPLKKSGGMLSLRIKKDRGSVDGLKRKSVSASNKKSPGRTGDKDVLTDMFRKTSPGRSSEANSAANSPGRKDSYKDQLTVGDSSSKEAEGTNERPSSMTSDTDSPSTMRRGSKVAKSCHVCGTRFGFMTSRVTCDNCRNPFCKNCISKKLNVPNLSKHARLCGECIKQVAKEQQQSDEKKEAAAAAAEDVTE